MTDLLLPLPPARRTIKRPEEDIQKAVVRLWRIVGHPRADLLGIDVGAPVKLARVRKVAMGAARGWPDITMVLPDGRVGFMEVKAPGNGLDPAQREFRDRCQMLGRPWALVRSVDEALEAWREWGAVKIKRPGGNR